jgi:hypothetical protein
MYVSKNVRAEVLYTSNDLRNYLRKIYSPDILPEDELELFIDELDFPEYPCLPLLLENGEFVFISQEEISDWYNSFRK